MEKHRQTRWCNDTASTGGGVANPTSTSATSQSNAGHKSYYRALVPINLTPPDPNFGNISLNVGDVIVAAKDLANTSMLLVWSSAFPSKHPSSAGAIPVQMVRVNSEWVSPIKIIGLG